jgi:hypothetical protein
MKTSVFFLALVVLLSSSIALACRCRNHTTVANAYLRSCVTAITSLLITSDQSVSDIATCQDERLGETGAHADTSVSSSAVTFLEDGETFTVTVNVINDAVISCDGESILLITKPTVTFSQRMNCWWERVNIFSPCQCSCSY